MSEIIKLTEWNKDKELKPDITTTSKDDDPEYINGGVVYVKCSNCGAEAGFKFSIRNTEYVNISIDRISDIHPVHICGRVGSCTEIGRYEVTHMVIFDWVKRIVSKNSVIYIDKLTNKMINSDTEPYNASSTYLCNYLKPEGET